MVADLVDQDVGDQITQVDIAAGCPFVQDWPAKQHDAIEMAVRTRMGFLGQIDADIDAGQVERVLQTDRFERFLVGEIGDKDLDAVAHVADPVRDGVPGFHGESFEIIETWRELRFGGLSGHLPSIARPARLAHRTKIEHSVPMDLNDVSSASNPDIDDAQALARGAARLLWNLGYSAIPEFILPDGRRADLFAVGRKGEVAIVEVKSGIADFQADNKWTDYSAFCDTFYFAVSQRFPHDLIPNQVGLIIADGFGGAIVRESPLDRLAAARRKAITLRFARAAADRLMRTGED